MTPGGQGSTSLLTLFSLRSLIWLATDKSVVPVLQAIIFPASTCKLGPLSLLPYFILRANLRGQGSHFVDE